MDKGATLEFGEILVKALDVKYYRENNLEIRSISVIQVKLLFLFI
jgi:hypothetical protein